MVNSSPLPDWLQRLYPFTPAHFTTPSGARMSYVDVGGQGTEAVLMLHGNPTWSFYYRNVVAALQGKYRCIVPDHIGMGLSDKPADYIYQLSNRIADIEALVAHLGLKKIHLIVHDWGGAIGSGFATRHPEMIGKMVILNTAAFRDVQIPGRIAICRLPVIGKWLVQGLNGFAWPATWMAMSFRSLTAEEKRGYLFPYDSWAHRIAVHRFVVDIPMESDHPSRDTLDEIAAHLPTLAQKPIFIGWGARDFCFDDHFLARWRGLYPQAEIHRYARAGHYVLEDSTEVIGDIVKFIGG